MLHIILQIAQFSLAAAVTILILIQERSSGISGVFGGDGGGFYQTRRGLEKIVFAATIVFSILFFVLSLVRLWL